MLVRTKLCEAQAILASYLGKQAYLFPTENDSTVPARLPFEPCLDIEHLIDRLRKIAGTLEELTWPLITAKKALTKPTSTATTYSKLSLCAGDPIGERALLLVTQLRELAANQSCPGYVQKELKACTDQLMTLDSVDIDKQITIMRNAKVQLQETTNRLINAGKKLDRQNSLAQVASDVIVSQSSPLYCDRLQRLSDIAGGYEFVEEDNEVRLVGLANLVRGKEEYRGEITLSGIADLVTQLTAIITFDVPVKAHAIPKPMPSMVNAVLQAVNKCSDACYELIEECKLDATTLTPALKVAQALQQLIASYPAQKKGLFFAAIPSATKNDLTSSQDTPTKVRMELIDLFNKLRKYLLSIVQDETSLQNLSTQINICCDLLSTLQFLINTKENASTTETDKLIDLYFNTMQCLIALLYRKYKKFSPSKVLDAYVFHQKLCDSNDKYFLLACSAQTNIENWLFQYSDAKANKTSIRTLLDASRDSQKAAQLFAVDSIDLREYPFELFMVVLIKSCDEAKITALPKKVSAYSASDIADTLNLIIDEKYLCALISMTTKLLGFASPEDFLKTILKLLPEDDQEDFSATISLYNEIQGLEINADEWLEEFENAENEITVTDVSPDEPLVTLGKRKR